MSTAAHHRYRLHGLAIESALELPELPPAASDGPPDVTITVGPTPANLERALKRGGCYEAEPERFLIGLEGVARFLVSHGREIRVEPAPGASAAEVRRLLLSSPLAALLLQRGLLPLHASAVALDGAGVMFVGGPCAGKSTFAARLRERGGRILADDIAAVEFDDRGRPWLLPGCAETKLWRDSREALGGGYEDLPRVSDAITKRVRRFPATFDPARVPLRRIYVLESDRRDEFAVAATAGPACLAALLRHTYRAGFVAGAAGQRRLFGQLAQLAKAVEFSSVYRPEDRLVDRELADRVQEDLKP